MVAIIAGNGLGLFNASSNILGGATVLGQSSLGQAGARSYVNAATGNLTLQAGDEYLSGRGMGLPHLRTYNSQGALNDGDGDGWRWDGERSVVLQGSIGTAGSTVTRTESDGHETVYTWAVSRYTSSEGGGAHDSVVFDSATSQWVWTDGSSRLTERYSGTTGKLVSQHDVSGNSITYQYDGSGRLAGVTDVGSGQRLVLTYATVTGNANLTRLKRVETVALTVDSFGRPTTVLGSPVRQVEYAHDASGRLTSVRTDLTPSNPADNAIYTTDYVYDGSSARIASVTHSDGATASFAYEAGRVKTATDANGTQSFSYQIDVILETGVTTLTTNVSLDVGDGSPQVWTYICDGANRLIEMKTPPPTPGAARLSTRFKYDEAGNVLRVTDARGNSTDYEYDGLGNRRLERDSQGNTVVRTFDDRHQPVTETHYQVPDPDGSGAQPAGSPVTMRFVFDGQSRLRFVVGAEGGVSEYRYGTAGASTGLLTHTILYTMGRYEIGREVPPSLALTEEQLTTWVAGQDKTKVQQTEFAYDLRGNVSKRTDFGKVSASGAGILDATAVVNEYIYDAHGDLLQTIIVSGTARDRRITQTGVVRDGLGREVQMVDAAGTTTAVYDGAKRIIEVTTQAGLAVTSSFDNRGRLVSMSQSGSGSSRAVGYVYDAAGRLRLVTDQQGGKRFNFYDAAGRLRFLVDSAGAVNGFEYDAAGQVTAETRYHNPANTSGWYDATAKTVTKHALAIGTDIVPDSVNDRVTRYAYDGSNRLTAVTDAAGTVTQTGYDGRSLVTQQHTANRITRFFYDRDGVLIGIVDPRGFLTESTFDAGGRLVQRVRYSTRSTAALDVAPPLWIGITNQTATGGRLFEYRMPAFDADGDALTYRVVGTKPNWLTLDTSTGTAILKGTPPTTPATYTVTVQADDQRGKTSDVTVGISVVNTAPAWTSLPDAAVPVNTLDYHLTLPPASDAESAESGLTYSIVSAIPAGLQFSEPQRLLFGRPAAPGAYTVVARVTDPQGRFTDRSFALTVTNIGPTWAPVPTQRLIAGQPFNLTVPRAADPENQSLAYSVVSKPGWLAFNTGTRVLSGTPTSTGFATVELRAQDPHGKTVNLSFGLTVITNSPPTWAQLPSIVTPAGSPIDYTPPAAVDPEGETLAYSAVSGLPDGLSVNSYNGRIVGTTMVLGTYQVVLRATDLRGGFVDRSVSLEVKNSVPVYSGGLFDKQYRSESIPWEDEADFGIAPGTFMDPNGDALIYTWAKTNPSESGWLAFDEITLRFSGTVPSDAPNAYSFVVTVTATDVHGAAVSGSFTVEVSEDIGNALTGSAPAAGGSVPPSPGSDVLDAWRPANTEGLRSYLYYDSLGRVVGSVDENGFLSETVFDEHLNKQHNVRYRNAVKVVAADTLATLKAKAGSGKLTETFEFDDLGRVSRIIGPDGTVTGNEYDSAGRLVRGVYAVGSNDKRASRVRYNAHGEVTGTLGGVGEATLPGGPSQAVIDAAITEFGLRYEYDDLGRRAKVIDANNNALLFFYDSENRQTHTINAEREVSETTYTSEGQPATLRRYANRITGANHSGLTGGPATQLQGKLPTADPAKDQIVQYEYDRRGLLVKQIDGEGFVTSRTFTPLGQVATEVRAIAENRSVTTQFDYDLRDGLVSQTIDVGGTNFNQRTDNDASGRVIRSVDPAGNVTTATYHDDGRTVEVTDALDRTVQSEYDTLGRLKKHVDASDGQTVYAYGDAERTISVVSPEDVQVTMRMTEHGQIHEVVDGRGGTTTYAYDANGQLTSVKDALDRVIHTNVYDKSGRLRESTDANGQKVLLGYDKADRITQLNVDGDDLVSSFEFDALGQPFKATDNVSGQAARVTSYEYDRNGRLKQIIADPDGLRLSARYTFDGLGNAVTIEQGTVADPGQQITTYEFDNLGRLVKQILAPSAILGQGAPGTRDIATEYRYDAAGRVCRMIHAGEQSVWYVYDAAGHQTHVINAEGEVTRSTYDINSRLISTRRYVNRLSAATLAGLGDVAGPVTPSADANDQRTHLVYDKDGRLRFTLSAVRGTLWSIAESRFDANGNVIESRRYDKFLPEARLEAIDSSVTLGITVAKVVTELESLGYSDNASTLTKVQRTRFAYDANDHLRFTVDAQDAVSESVYDTGGNVVARVRYAVKPALSAYTESVINAAVDRNHADNQITRFAYDSAGRLRYTARVLESDGHGKATKHLISEVVYDALGRITQKAQYATVIGMLADYRLSTLANAVTADPQDRREVLVLDMAGRLVYKVRVLSPGAQGKHLVVKTEYDALSRIVRRTAFARELVLADLTMATLDAAVTANADAKDRTTSVVYDVAGRPRFAVGPDGSLSETVYDAAGRVSERRQLDFLVELATARTEQALSERRGGRVVGDGVTHGERYSYDRAGRLLTVTDATGFVQTNVYNGLGDRISHTDNSGAVCVYHYDRQGRVFRKVSPSVEALVVLPGNTVPSIMTIALEDHSFYDALGNPVKTIERANTADARTADYTFDTLGRLTTTALPGYFDLATGKVERADGSGRFRREVTLTYDALGNAVRSQTRTGPDTHQFEYKTYDPLGRAVYDVDPLNNVIAFTYTSFDEQRQVTRHSVTITGTPVNASHWTTGELSTQVAADAIARTVTTSYDTAGRKVEALSPAAGYFHGDALARSNAASVTPVTAQPAIRYVHNAFGDVRHEAVKLNATQWQDTWHYFDVMGREVRTVDTLGQHTTRAYDVFGNLVRTVEFARPGEPGSDSITEPGVSEDPDDRISEFTYNTLNQRTSNRRLGARYTELNGGTYRPVERERGFPTTMQSFTYDSVGRVQTQTDGLGGITLLTYDALGRLIQTVEPARQAAAPGSVDPFRNPVTAAPVTSLLLDAFGSVVRQLRQPGGGAGQTQEILYGYDASGNLISTLDTEGGMKLRRVDYAGRVVLETQDVSVALGGWQTNSHTLKRKYAYDATGRQTHTLDVFLDGTETQSGVHNIYSVFGEVLQERMVWGPAATALSSLNPAVVTTYTHDNAGHVIAKVAGDGTTRYHYNLAGQVTRQEQLGDPSVAGGPPARVTETGYDRLGRAIIQRLPLFTALTPTSETVITPLVEQGYDRWGNAILRAVGRYVRNDTGAVLGQSAVTKYRYNADSQLTAELLPTVEVALNLPYDAAGADYAANLRHELRYDQAGRVVQEIDLSDVQATTADEAKIHRIRSRQYNAVGALVSETDGTGITTQYAYDAHGNKVGVRNAAGTVTTDTFDRNGNLVTHSVLRQANGTPYNGGGSQVPVARVLQRYQYDQANRRVASGDVMDGASNTIHWSYTKLDERNYARANRNPSGAVTTCDYDKLGNKAAETDASGKTQTWVYSTHTTDHSAGRLLSTTVDGNRTTGYEYDGFGAVQIERYPVESLPAADTFRRYQFHQNGLVKVAHEVLAMGTLGAAGEADYWTTEDFTIYAYTALGQVHRERFTRTGLFEVELLHGLGDPTYEPATLDPVTRTTYTTYDALGRMRTVIAPGNNTENPGRGSLDITYRYDELGNRRNVHADYVPPSSISLPNPLGGESDLWHTYDAEGRMLIADGVLHIGSTSNTIKAGHTGTTITYDTVGRRRTAERFLRSDSDPDAEEESIVWGWSDYRGELYDYSDLNYLTTVSQRITQRDRVMASNGNHVPLGDGPPGPWKSSEVRLYDIRGNVTNNVIFKPIRSLGYNLGTISATRSTIITLNYRPDGQLGHQHTTDETGKSATSTVNNSYNNAGLLTSYTYQQGKVLNADGTQQSPAFTNTYNYEYITEFGGSKEQLISVSSNLPGANAGRTKNSYDPRGLLIGQSIGTAGTTTTARSFSYDTDRRVVTKDELSRSSSATTVAGKQNFTYATGRQVATVGIGSLQIAQFTNGYTPISASYPHIGATTHVISHGDTLAGLAQLYFGDTSQWPLIAEANSSNHGPADPLPDTEIGKTYRIPNLVANIHNNATTFLPYSLSDIIGNQKPVPYFPPPPPRSPFAIAVDVLAIAVSMVVTFVVKTIATYYLGPVLGGFIGGAVGNAAGQFVRIGFGQQDGFDYKAMFAAGIGGAIGEHSGKAIGSKGIGEKIVTRSIGYVGQGFARAVVGAPPSGGSATGLGIEMASAILANYTDTGIIAWSEFANTFANSALDPDNGWLRNDRTRDWAYILDQAAGAFTTVAVGALINKFTQPPPATETEDDIKITEDDIKFINKFAEDNMYKVGNATWAPPPVQKTVLLASNDDRGAERTYGQPKPNGEVSDFDAEDLTADDIEIGPDGLIRLGIVKHLNFSPITVADMPAVPVLPAVPAAPPQLPQSVQPEPDDQNGWWSHAADYLPAAQRPSLRQSVHPLPPRQPFGDSGSQDLPTQRQGAYALSVKDAAQREKYKATIKARSQEAVRAIIGEAARTPGDRQAAAKAAWDASQARDDARAKTRTKLSPTGQTNSELLDRALTPEKLKKKYGDPAESYKNALELAQASGRSRQVLSTVFRLAGAVSLALLVYDTYQGIKAIRDADSSQRPQVIGHVAGGIAGSAGGAYLGGLAFGALVATGLLAGAPVLVTMAAGLAVAAAAGYLGSKIGSALGGALGGLFNGQQLTAPKIDLSGLHTEKLSTKSSSTASEDPAPARVPAQREPNPMMRMRRNVTPTPTRVRQTPRLSIQN